MAKILPAVNLSRKNRILIGAGIVVFLAALAVFLVWFLQREMTWNNPRMTMMHLQVVSEGWWKDRADVVESLMRPEGEGKEDPETALHPGTTNLFSLNLSRIRAGLEQVPEISRARVERILPDTLRITLTERIPCAALKDRKSALADEDGFVLSRRRSPVPPASLPLVTGFRERIPAHGEKMESILPALEMIMLCRRKYPEIKVVSVDLSPHDHMLVRIFFRGDMKDSFRVRINREEIPASMDVLITAIRDFKRRGAPGRIIDLRIRGQIIFQPKL